MSDGQDRSEKPVGTQKGPKFRRRAEARPDEVLDAALSAFMEKGYSAARMDDIARRAGISKGAIYLYFSSKEALLEALVQRAVAPVAENAIDMARLHEGEPRMVLTQLVTMIAKRFSDPQMAAIPQLIMREAVQFPEIAEMYRATVIDRMLPVVTRVIANGVRLGVFKPVDPQLTVFTVVGPLILQLFLFNVFRVHGANTPELEPLVENHLKIVFCGLQAEED